MRQPTFAALLAAVLFALALAACRTIPVAGECPEAQDLRCLTKKVCSEDRDRGCQVCQCEAPYLANPSNSPDSAVPALPHQDDWNLPP